MRQNFILLSAVALTACSGFQDTPGQVSGVDERGRFFITGPKQFGVDPAPTERMTQQAKEVCPNAQYVDSRPSTADFNLFEFEFYC